MSLTKDENAAKRPKTEADLKTMTNKQYLDQVIWAAFAIFS